MPHDDIVLVELGAIVGRLERELRLQMQAFLAEAREAIAAIRQERAEARLELATAAQDLASDVAARLAEVRDGIDGKDGAPGPPGADSTVPGPPGANGRSCTVRGIWSATETYAASEIVALDGSTWLAKHDDPGPCPGDGWLLNSPRGRAGPPGPKGEKGDRGEPGPAAPLPVSGEASPDGLVTFFFDNDWTVTVDFHAPLAQLGLLLNRS